MRAATIVIGFLDALACAVVAVGSYNSGSDPATLALAASNWHSCARRMRALHLNPGLS